MRFPTAHALHQFSVNFTDEAARDRELVEKGEPSIHRPDVVNDLLDVDARLGVILLCLIFQDVHERGLGSLDLAGENGLPEHVHVHKPVRVGDNFSYSVQASHGKIGTGE